MDFLRPFPESEGFDYLWVIICCLSSMVHLVPVNTMTTATELSSLFVKEVVQLHGLPSSIVSDRDLKFTSRWWCEVHRILDIKLLMSTSFHPQTDGLMERVNHSIMQILRGFIASNQKDWVGFLAFVEFAINLSINRATGMTLFEVNYSLLPQMMRELPVPEHVPPGVCTFVMDALCNMAIAHDSIITERVFHSNKHRHKEPEIEAGGLVYLSTKNLALPKGCASKLVPKFVGPYWVLHSFPNTSNYELELPEELSCQRVHNRFHVGLLRPHHANNNALFPNRRLPDPYDFSAPDNSEWYVEEIMAHHWKGHALELQVKWSVGESTWEPLAVCNELAALDSYLALLGAKDWVDLPRHAVTHTGTC